MLNMDSMFYNDTDRSEKYTNLFSRGINQKQTKGLVGIVMIGLAVDMVARRFQVMYCVSNPRSA